MKKGNVPTPPPPLPEPVKGESPGREVSNLEVFKRAIPEG
jgi:hypothetical protein